MKADQVFTLNATAEKIVGLYSEGGAYPWELVALNSIYKSTGLKRFSAKGLASITPYTTQNWIEALEDLYEAKLIKKAQE